MARLGACWSNEDRFSAEAIALALREQEKGDRRRLGEILVSMGFGKQAPETYEMSYAAGPTFLLR